MEVVTDSRKTNNGTLEFREEDLDAQIQAWDLIYAMLAPIAAKSACKLGIVDILAKSNKPLTLEEIASMLQPRPQNMHSLFRLMRYLSLKGFFSLHNNSSYGLTPLSKWMLSVEASSINQGFTLEPLLQLINYGKHMSLNDHIADSILYGGVPLQRAHGEGITTWKLAENDPTFNHIFNSAMENTTNLCLGTLLKHYSGFSNVSKLVDVGGGIGITCSRIVACYPSIKAINFDLPHVIEHAPPHPGVEHIGGDAFKEIPSGDTLLMKWILHGWNDDLCLKILENCRKALPEDGKLIIVETILDIESPYNKIATSLDLHMFFVNPGGKERTIKEWKDLLHGAGFSKVNFIKLPSLESVIEAFPI